MKHANELHTSFTFKGVIYDPKADGADKQELPKEVVDAATEHKKKLDERVKANKQRAEDEVNENDDSDGTIDEKDMIREGSAPRTGVNVPVPAGEQKSAEFSGGVTPIVTAEERDAERKAALAAQQGEEAKASSASGTSKHAASKSTSGTSSSGGKK